jgi:excisionase family DNA binding protein
MPTLHDMQHKEDGPTLGTRHAVELIGISGKTVRELIKAGDIRGVYVGRCYKIPWRNLRSYLFKSGVLPLVN